MQCQYSVQGATITFFFKERSIYPLHLLLCALTQASTIKAEQRNLLQRLQSIQVYLITTPSVALVHNCVSSCQEEISGTSEKVSKNP